MGLVSLCYDFMILVMSISDKIVFENICNENGTYCLSEEQKGRLLQRKHCSVRRDVCLVDFPLSKNL